MGLVKNITIAVVVLVVVFGLAMLLAQNKPSGGIITESQAAANVTKDLSETYLGANITILNATELSNGNYSFLVRLLFNGTRACPTIYTNTYIYPGFTFVPIQYNSYVPSKIGCTQPNGRPNVIASPYIAVGWATNQSLQLLTYLNQYGYKNVTSGARLYKSLQVNESGQNVNLTDVWLVSYSAAGTNSSFNVVMYENGSVISRYYS